MVHKALLKIIVFAQVILTSAFIAPSFADDTGTNWVPCGKQDKECNLDGTADTSAVLIRYGLESKNNYFFFGVQGQDTAPCSNFNGNPSDGDSKSCWRYADDSFLPEGAWWEKCALEGGVCNFNDNVMWVRYGADDKWLYTLQSNTFECSNEYFGWDPDSDGKTGKACYIGYPVAINNAQTWTTCATERETCDLTELNYNNSGIVIKYGVDNAEDDSWFYKIATQSNSFECSNEIFGDPSVGNHKSCQFYPYLLAPIETTGNWIKQVDCRGDYCDDQYSITWGSEWSDSVSNQITWTLGVTQSVSAGIQIGPLKAESSVGYSAAFANSTTYQTSMTDTYEETTSTNCGQASENERQVIYQFSTNSAAACLTGTGMCSSQTLTQDFICYTGPANGSIPEPQCLPNACADTYCTQCLAD